MSSTITAPFADNAPPAALGTTDIRRSRWKPDPDRPSWSLPARISIAAVAAFFYLWDLSRNGYGNEFYAAAVKAGTKSWKAFFFGSIDPGNFITVDKPPASFWGPEIFARIFGFSSWTILIPEAIAGVASVLILYRLVRLWAGEVAAVLASAAFALTPVAVLMFRFNNPDAFLVLFLLLAAWAISSAVQSGSTRMLALGASMVGLAFLAKQLEAWVVMPALAFVYLWAAPVNLGRRIKQLLIAGVVMVASSGWWVAIVQLWPKSSRPYIGGSTGNSELNLIFGYNGFSRIFGSGGGSGAGGATNFGGSRGIFRLFNSQAGGEIGWLLPLAILGLVGGLWLTRKAPRIDRLRAGFLLWGCWTFLCFVVFSFSKGIFHPYYTVEMAPGVAALAGAGSVSLWKLGRSHRSLAWALPLGIGGTAWMAFHLLHRTSGYDTALTWAILVVGIAAALAMAAYLFDIVKIRALAVAAALTGAVVVMAGPTAYSLTNINKTVSSGLASSGPSGAGSSGFGGFGGGGVGRPGRFNINNIPARFRKQFEAFRGQGGGGFGGGGFGGGGFGRGASTATATETPLDKYLVAHQGSSQYIVTVSGDSAAEPIIIATGKGVIAMGGFGGSDAAPTLAQFKSLVATGKVHYVLVSSGGGDFGGGGFGGSAVRGTSSAAGRSFAGGFGGGRGGGTSSTIDAWAKQVGTVVPASTYGGSTGETLYYISSAAATSAG